MNGKVRRSGRTRSEQEPPEQYLLIVSDLGEKSKRNSYSITIHRLDPFKYEPWYLARVSKGVEMDHRDGLLGDMGRV